MKLLAMYLSHYFPRKITLFLVLFILELGIGYSYADESTQDITLRCGWFDNPSPNNAWLNDKDGEWTVSIQGGHQAKGEWPQFKRLQWVRTGSGSYGYGCVCMKVRANAESQEIIQIISAAAKPLSACRQDKVLKEPENPLK